MKTWMLALLFLSPSAWSHTEGMTVDQNRPGFQQHCQVTTNPADPELQAQASRVFSRVYDANHNLFTGFSQSKTDFCVSVDNGLTPNAGATVQTGQIQFTQALLKNVSSEEAAAAIMGHETAHIAMNHEDPIPFEWRMKANPATLRALRDVVSAGESLFLDRANRQAYFTSIQKKLKDAVARDSDANRKRAGLRALADYEQASKDMKDAGDKSSPLWANDDLYERLISVAGQYGVQNQALTEIHQKIKMDLVRIALLEIPIKKQLGSTYSPKVFSNFREREADEVGLEMYVRAGYDPDRYEEGILSIIKIRRKLQSIDEARSYCDALEAQGKLADGDSSHPLPCWRLRNIQKEVREHADYFARIRGRPAERSSTPSAPQGIR